MSQVLIWGASGHASVVAGIVRMNAKRHIVGFLEDTHRERQGMDFCGSRILAGTDVLAVLGDTEFDEIIVAIGDCAARIKAASMATKNGFKLGTASHPRATIARDVMIGAGSVVVAGAVINPGARIGCNVIVNTSSSIDHECFIEDGAHIGPGAHLGGRVTVGAGTWIGIGAAIRDRITIGANSIIGAGSVVVNDIPSGVVAYGVPAKVVRENRTS